MKFVSNLYRKLFDYITPTERRTCGIACQKCRTSERERETAAEIGWMKCFGIIGIQIWAEWRTNWQLRLPLPLLLGAMAKIQLAFFSQFLFLSCVPQPLLLPLPLCSTSISRNRAATLRIRTVTQLDVNWIELFRLICVSRNCINYIVFLCVARIGLLSP